MHFGILLLSPIIASHIYPNCTQTPFFVTTGSPIAINPADFLEIGVVSDDCEDTVCQATSSFRVNSTEACGTSCSRISGCDWWSASIIWTTPRINRTICHLFSSNGSSSVEGVKIENSTSGHKNCSINYWPSCVRYDHFSQSRGYSELWINASKMMGLPAEHSQCNLGNCTLTDSIPVSSIEKCAALCGRMEKCHSWSVTSEQEIGYKCWFRRHVFKMIEQKGAVSGDSTCGNHSPYDALLYENINDS